MNDIADEIALSRATIYNYFSKKEDIYFGIFNKELDDICTKYLARSAHPKSEYDETLLMAKILFKKLHKNPLIFRIYTYFLAKLQELNLSGEELIIKNGFNIDYIKSQISPEYDNTSFIKLIETYNKYVKLAFSDIVKNSNPKLIQSPLKLMQLYYVIGIIVQGYGIASSFPLQPQSQIKSTNDKIVQVLLDLIEKIAKGDISIDF